MQLQLQRPRERKGGKTRRWLTKKEGNVAERETSAAGEQRRTREREAAVNGCVHCTLFPCPASVPRSVISETSAPRVPRVRYACIYIYKYIYIVHTYIFLRRRIYIYTHSRVRTERIDAVVYARAPRIRGERCVHTREIVRTSVIDLFREEAGISGLREGSGREIKGKASKGR